MPRPQSSSTASVLSIDERKQLAKLVGLFLLWEVFMSLASVAWCGATMNLGEALDFLLRKYPYFHGISAFVCVVGIMKRLGPAATPSRITSLGAMLFALAAAIAYTSVVTAMIWDPW